jgi:CelD/BcsL family acetyltransferase involved in cellulose biosynthesis
MILSDDAPAAPALRFSVELTGDAERLAAAIPQWEELAARAIEPNPMYEHWMLLPALRFFGAGVVCAMVWMRDAAHPAEGAKLCGLFPFIRVRRFKGIPATALSSWSHNSWMLCTPLVRADHAPRCLAALLDWVEDGGEGSSVLEFRYLASDGAFHGALADALRSRNSMVLAASNFTRAFLRKAASAEAYLDSALSGVGRKSMRRKEKRLAERGGLSHVVMQPAADPWPWIDAFLQLEASGWKGRQGSALASSKNSYLFACETLSAAHRRNRLHIMGIDLDGKPIARCCNIAAGEGSYAYRTAYDEAFAYYSPGVMAELDSIRHIHSLPRVRWMDSITDPDNITLNRLWKERRTMQTVVVGSGAWGELWVSMLPMVRWAKRRIATTTHAISRSVLRGSDELAQRV